MNTASALINEFLNLSTMTLASADMGCGPHAAAVYFAADEELNLYFFSDPRSQHIQDILQDPRAAVTIQPECFDWHEIRGLQMRGSVQTVEPGAAHEQAWQLYWTKFPFVEGMRAEVARTTLYVFQPQWIRLIDNRQGFGFRQEWVRGTAGAGGEKAWLPVTAGKPRG
jgi:uncharacterized protein YhbP (UPF0306 family)